MATIYKQYDTRWGSLKYPSGRYTVSGSGCALVGLTNLLIEYPKYASATPKTFYSYLKQFAVAGDGTKRAGVATALKNYGFTDVRRFQDKPMKDSWAYFSKGYRGLIVMSSNLGGSKKIRWTTTGHYIAVTNYKVENGKHYLYCKDSGARKHDGWYNYEDHMRGAVSDVIIGDPSALKAKAATTAKTETKALWNKDITLKAQKKFGTVQDGIVSGQNEGNKKYHVAMDPASWKYGKNGSSLIKAIQKTLGATQTGHFNADTIKALQKALGIAVDGYFGAQSLAAFTDYLNGKKTLNIDAPKPSTSTTTTSSYTGTLPTTKLKKTNAQVIADTITWLKWHANDNSFHYGYTSKDKKIDAHHNGCYYCGTNTTSGGRSKKGIVDYQKTYCCNPFIGAGFAHGGCVPEALKLCRNGTSWDFHKGRGYDASKLFTKLGKPKKSSLPTGAVLCRDTHVAMYIGGSKIVHAAGGDDNKRNSEKWNNSIRIDTLTDAKYKAFTRVYKYNSSVNTDCSISHGEVSDRVGLWQKFLNWYFGKTVVTVDRCYGDTTLKYTKSFQEKEIGKGQGDGYIGAKTLAAAAKAKKTTAVAKETKTPQQKAVDWAVNISKDDTYGYKRWSSDVKTHQCPICHPGSGNGWNCIGFVTAAYYHGAGVKNLTCSCFGVRPKGKSGDITLARWQARNGKDWTMITNGAKETTQTKIPASKLKPGDILLKFGTDGDCKHYYMYIGDNKVVESATDKVAKAKQIRVTTYDGRMAQRAFRYTGK